MKIAIRREPQTNHLCLVNAETGEALPHQVKCTIVQDVNCQAKAIVEFWLGERCVPIQIIDEDLSAMVEPSTDGEILPYG